ncbi:lysophospholipid acyltransferase family protein [Hydromonas duriensis]|uniref:1-acyl-sn-glycerol-3-phosphate acyltransferase n=1 Tax=Hydromonas duriensis TaxID=1527608 RepID=A0A4R6YC05_9BURK|nr:lysophospholipid acyltransferase family protein [Hydromonas duriensis]TDR33144.1 1-acyl-sn-glycerol-3-phosphate acyltransferase [Hydromonas duriensis]
MAMIRSAIFIVCVVLWTIPFSMLCMLTAVLPYRYRYAFTSIWNRVTIFAARWILGIRYEVRGMDNLPPKGSGAVVLSKHQSAWETIFLLYALGNPLCFVFKRELLWVPFFGWGLGLLRMVAIDRSSGVDAFEQTVTQARVRLSDGVWMIMFPEGTRIMPGASSKFKTGGARLATALEAPIIPIAHNAGECWPKKPWVKRAGKVTVSIGPMIHSKGREVIDVHNEMVTWIQTEMKRLPKAC